MSAAEPENPTSEEELIRRIVAGERELYTALIRPYERRLYVTAYGILRSAEEAEDAVQESLFKAYKALGGFRAEAKFSTWLIQITTNECLQRLRAQKRAPVESLETGQAGEERDYKPRDFADWREIPSESLEHEETRLAVRKAIEGLKESYRNILVLRDIQQLSVAETAAALGITEANVKVRLLRARLMLRDALAPGWGGKWQRQKGGGR